MTHTVDKLGFNLLHAGMKISHRKVELLPSKLSMEIGIR